MPNAGNASQKIKPRHRIAAKEPARTTVVAEA